MGRHRSPRRERAACKWAVADTRGRIVPADRHVQQSFAAPIVCLCSAVRPGLACMYVIAGRQAHGTCACWQQQQQHGARRLEDDYTHQGSRCQARGKPTDRDGQGMGHLVLCLGCEFALRCTRSSLALLIIACSLLETHHLTLHVWHPAGNVSWGLQAAAAESTTEARSQLHRGA